MLPSNAAVTIPQPKNSGIAAQLMTQPSIGFVFDTYNFDALLSYCSGHRPWPILGC
jgi:hypothetical protein